MTFSQFKSEVNEYDGVYQIKIDVPFGVRFVSLYLFKVEEKNVLIDAGLNSKGWIKIFFKRLKELNMTLNDIDTCIITHSHIDHIGLSGVLREKNPEAEILMHDITQNILEWETDKGNSEEIEQEAIKVSFQLKRYGLSEEQRKRVVQFFTYWPKLRQYQKPDRVLHDGDTVLKDLEVIWTPGHSFGHICVFNKKKRHLFSGDHVLSRITPHIGNFVVPEFISKQYSDYNFNNVLDQYLQSLDRINELRPEIIFPGHQDIIYNPQERITQIKEHHKQRLADISEVIKDNPMTPFKISKIHFGEDLDEINSFLGLSEVLGHLLYLEDKKQVKTIEKNGQILYYS
jgi:glyoxylase-like metal-dependent hydrolase (beta-lactamase superfamily II)